MVDVRSRRHVVHSKLTSNRGQGNAAFLIVMVCIIALVALQVRYCAPTPPPAVVKPAVTDAAKAILALDIPGVNAQREYKRYYPDGASPGSRRTCCRTT